MSYTSFMDEILNARPEVTEVEFEKYFLNGIIEGEEATIENYLKHVAGGYFTSVNIVDPESRKILFVIPPLKRTPRFNNGEAVDITEAMRDILRKQNVHPAKGTAARKKLTSNMKFDTGHENEDATAWLAILRHYGRLPDAPTELDDNSNSIDDW